MLIRWMLFVCLLLMFHCSAYAMIDSMRAPLPTQQSNPIMLRFFNPIPVSAFDMHTTLSFEQNYASLNMFYAIPKASFLVDTELYMPTLQLRHRLNDQHLFNIRVPFYRPYNGVLDGFLQKYHQLFGLPNNGREFRPTNQMGYYVQPGWTAQNRWELGNISLELQSQLYRNEQWAVALLSSVQFATASRIRGWSSGNTDLSLGIVSSWYGNIYFSHFELRGVRIGVADVGFLRYQNYWRTSVTLGRDLGKDSSLLLQVQGGSSPYKTGLFVLDQNPWMFNLGFRVQGDTVEYTVNFGENITQYTTADFSFGLNMRWFFH